MKKLLVTRRKVTGLVTMGVLLLGINNGWAALRRDGEPTPMPSPAQTATPLPTSTPIASATPTRSSPVPTITPAVSPPTTTPAPTTSSGSGAFPGLGTAGKYAVLSLVGTFQSQSSTTINGNVGIGPYGSGTSQSTINGSVYYDPSTRYSGTGVASGGTYQQSMMQAALDASKASYYYRTYANQSNVFSSISAATTIVGHTGYNVFNLSGGISLNNANLTLSGSANDYFVFNIYGGLSLTGTSSISLTGGLTSSNVLFNFIGTGSALTTQLGTTVRGTILSIGRSISFDGVLYGELIGSRSTFALLSGAAINPFAPSTPVIAPGAPATTVPDQGSTLWLSLLGLSALFVFQQASRRILAPKQT